MKKRFCFLALCLGVSAALLALAGCSHSRADLVSMPEYSKNMPSYEGAPCVFLENTDAYPGNAKAASIIRRELESRGIVVVNRKNLMTYQSFRKVNCILCVNTVMERVSSELSDKSFARDVLLVVSVSTPGGADTLGEKNKVYFAAWSRDFLNQEVKYHPFVVPAADLNPVVKNLFSLPEFQQKIMACRGVNTLDPVPFAKVSNQKITAADALSPEALKKLEALKNSKSLREFNRRNKRDRRNLQKKESPEQSASPEKSDNQDELEKQRKKLEQQLKKFNKISF